MKQYIVRDPRLKQECSEGVAQFVEGILKEEKGSAGEVDCYQNRYSVKTLIVTEGLGAFPAQMSAKLSFKGC